MSVNWLNSRINDGIIRAVNYHNLNEAIPDNESFMLFSGTSLSNQPTGVTVCFGLTYKYDNNNLGQMIMSFQGVYHRYRSWGNWSTWNQL